MALHLPQLDNYYEAPSEVKCRSILQHLGYDFTLQGNPNKYTLRQCFRARWKYLTGVIGKCLRHKTRSLEQLNLFKQHIVYVMACNKKLDFAQIVFDQMVECFTENKKSADVPYPLWLVLLMACTGTGYNNNHGEYMPFLVLSSKIINASPTNGDPHLAQRMENWVQNPYYIEVPHATHMADHKGNNGDEDEAEDEEDSNHSSANSVMLIMKTKILMTLRLILTWSKFHLRDWLAISFQG